MSGIFSIKPYAMYVRSESAREEIGRVRKEERKSAHVRVGELCCCKYLVWIKVVQYKNIRDMLDKNRNYEGI